MLKNRLCYGLLLLCTSAFFIFFNGYLSLYVFVLSLLFPPSFHFPYCITSACTGARREPVTRE